MSLSIGQTAPDFTLKDQSQKEVKLSDFAGKKNVVLVFYPLDWSPTCTNEHACFVNEMKQFETLDAAVLGVSVRVAIEAGARLGWDRWLGDRGRFIGMNSFGASGPGDDLFVHFGITAENAAETAIRLLGSKFV